MNYIGSKYTLSSFLDETISRVAGDDLSEKVFCDLFAGTGIVGKLFKSRVKKLISNDSEYYSYILNRHYIGNHKSIRDQEGFIDALNHAPLVENGFIYTHYCLGSGSQRNYFTDFNGKKIDTIRQKIEAWKVQCHIDENTYAFLLASLLESADTVANTASMYGSFLKDLKPSASKALVLEAANFELTRNAHEVYNTDSNSLIERISGDILYLDPPYNQREYGANYHMLNTIARYDDFLPMGKTGLRDYGRSSYCKKKNVLSAFESLIKAARFRYIFLSYNNEGLMSEAEIKTILSAYGHYDLAIQPHQRFKHQRNRKAFRTIESLHILEKFPHTEAKSYAEDQPKTRTLAH